MDVVASESWLDNRREVSLRCLPQPDPQGIPASGQYLSLTLRHRIVGVRADNDACVYTPMAEAQKGKVSLTVTKEQPLKAVYLVVMGAPKDHSLDPSSRKFPYQIMVK